MKTSAEIAAHPNLPEKPDHEQPAPEPSMVYVSEVPKWEYKELVLAADDAQQPSELELNAVGRKGWELVAVMPRADHVHYFFKRPLE